jgi:hypothetical protein
MTVMHGESPPDPTTRTEHSMRKILPLLPLTLAGACTAAPLSADNPITLLVGPDGGRAEADGIRIDVPAGAVSSEVTIRAFPKTRTIDGLATSSSTWSFGPEGQTFAIPISVSLAYSGEAAHPTMWWTKAGDLTTFTNLRTDAADGWATAAVAHFSEGAVAEETCGSGSGNSDGEEADDVDCVDGIDSRTGEPCDGGPAANQDNGEEADDGEEEGGDCVDGIDSQTGEACDGGPAANQDDGEEADDEEEAHGACEQQDEDHVEE